MPKRYREDLETGDRVFDDITEAIRWKYRLSHVRGKLQTKCPICHGNIPFGQESEHKQQCPDGAAATAKGVRPRKPQRPAKSLPTNMRELEAARAKPPKL